MVHSAGGDLVVTAAHCLPGGDTQAFFVPGLSGDDTPSGRWQVDQVYFDARWIASMDPWADYAIARVSGDGPVAAQVGPAWSLGVAPAAGTRVTVAGYPAGVGGRPIACAGHTGVAAGGFPSLACDGLVEG
ncbi:V8-like Glu-specific endopeptidase [Mycobacterium basiliense]|uniref:V8-like Glu-specific endopeptidase n=1 Tax=Mycobacterium basiliense TaxID=2094119 RepID=A0A447GCU1_9MYCO|nr:trypsin-like peptidase domain-containing protein [Mycobacterium basiliense]VDM88264.1 V8-like Glu-specific endopeptidase [Mycobacterium basiliense]